MTKDKGQNARAVYVVGGFALLAAVVYFTGLGIPLLGPDEPRYAEVAREMFERGDWVTPKLGGFDWFEKPALLYWFQIVGYKLFGVNEFAARIGSALSGLGTIASLYFIGRTFDAEQPETQNPKPETPLWFLVVGATAFGIIAFSRGASFDIILTFPVTAALACFYAFDAKERRSKTADYKLLAGFYVFVGVALLAKGLVGIVFPFAIVAFYYVLSLRVPPRAVWVSLFWGTALSLLVASIWYAPMYHANGWKFIDEFFVQHHFQRYTSNKYQHPQPFYFFFWVLPLMTLPWLPWFLGSVFRVGKSFVGKEERSPVAVFGLAWMLVPLVFFSLSGSKLPGYILPALPGALILTAGGVARFAAVSGRRALILKIVGAVVLIGSAVLAQFFIARFLREETVRHMVESANAEGYRDDRILMLHTLSHNAEFYAPGRLLRDPDGKQKRLFGVSEIIAEMRAAGRVEDLVMVPKEYLTQLTKNEQLETRVLDDNGELAIVVVRLKNG